MIIKRIYLVLSYLPLAVLHVFLLYLTLQGDLNQFFNDAQHRLGLGTDFAAYYNAGAGFLNGHGIYGQGPGFGFRYHPAFAASIGAWLSTMTFQQAFIVWIIIQEAALLFIIILIGRIARNVVHQWIAIACLVIFSPLYLEIFMGNATFITVAILMWALYFMQSNRMYLHNGLLLLSLLIKPLGLALLPAYLFTEYKRTPPLLLVLYLF